MCSVVRDDPIHYKDVYFIYTRSCSFGEHLAMESIGEQVHTLTPLIVHRSYEL
jgi:hypothetical protein